MAEFADDLFLNPGFRRLIHPRTDISIGDAFVRSIARACVSNAEPARARRHLSAAVGQLKRSRQDALTDNPTDLKNTKSQDLTTSNEPESATTLATLKTRLTNSKIRADRP
jgi:hypothetical protein